MWYLKREEDKCSLKTWSMVDGKLKEECPLSENNHDLVEVTEVKACTDCDSEVEVIFQNLQCIDGKTSKRFAIKEYRFYGMDDFSDRFGSCKTGQEFQKSWKSVKLVTTPETLMQKLPEPIATTDSNSSKGKSKKKISSNKKSKRALFPSDSTTEELVSPEKKIKPNCQESEIEAHRIGLFNLKWNTLNEPPKKWLDRPIDHSYVDKITEVLKVNPCAMVSGQTWIGIADVPRERIKKNEDVKGCKIHLIGGLHRRKAYEKASAFSEEHKRILQKVPIQIYDNQLTDSQIKMLAAQHNLTNVGSRKTTWVERVKTCRLWRFEMEGKNPTTDEVPDSSSAWRKDCQKMFVEQNKDANTLEPTLQTALLPKSVFYLWEEAVNMFHAGKLKDQNKKKSSKKELTQNQLGMPLQGLEDDTKILVLGRLNKGESSVKEFQNMCVSIKKKKRIQLAFCQYAGENAWEDVVRRFPNHATESKLASFAHVPLPRGSIPEVLLNLFKRAIMWEKEREHPTVDLGSERENLHYYEGKERATGLLLASEIQSLEESSVKSYIKKFKGFELTVVELVKKADIDELEILLMKIHSFNVDELAHYNIILILSGSFSLEDQEYVLDIMRKKVHHAQMAYYVDSSAKVTKGQLMRDSVTPMVVGHWSNTGTLQRSSDGIADTGNAFVFERLTSDRLPEKLYRALIERFSYPGGWILAKCNGSALLGALFNARNCMELASFECFRNVAKLISAQLKEKKEEHINVDEHDNDVDGVIINEEKTDKRAKEFVFSPVNNIWREEACKKLGVSYAASSESASDNYGGTFKLEKEPWRIEKIIADGNCLFRAVSFAIAGGQDHHEKLRTLTIEHMSKLGETFRQISAMDVEQYLQRSRMHEINTWGTDVELVVLACLLEVGISVFASVGNEKKWVTYSPKPASSNKHNEYIYLVNKRNEHFDFVLDI